MKMLRCMNEECEEIVLECNEDGDYSAVQCTDNGQCYCALVNGAKIKDTDYNVLEDGPQNEACLARQLLLSNSECMKEGGRCDMETGFYLPHQCRDESCYCVKDDGMKLMDSEHDSDYEDEAAEIVKCAEYRVMIESSACYAEKEAARSKMGAFSPNCDNKDGSYVARQCMGAECYCVNSAGVKLDQTEHVIAETARYSCEMKIAMYAESKCIQAKGDLSIPGTVILCDYETGYYAAQQCAGSECFCVTEQGEQIYGSDFHVSMSSTKPCGENSARFISCSAKRDMVMGSDSYLKGDKIPTCEVNGMYFSQQCEGSQCYCVDKFGYQKEGNTSHHVSQMSCSDPSDMMVSSAGLPSCAKASAAAGDRIGAYSPMCNEDGSYSSKQCHGSMCFCVGEDGVKTGDEFAVTANVLCRAPTCDEQYESERAEYGDEADVVECDINGGWMPEQCGMAYRAPDGDCACVDKQGNALMGTGHNSTDTFFCYKSEEGGDCLSVKEKLDAMMIPGGLYVVCDEDGDFGRQQCRGSMCSCYTDVGVKVKGSEHRVGANPCEMCKLTNDKYC